MYLSRLQLNPAHPQARRDLASAYELHRSLARAFAPDAATPPPRFLWRREADHTGLPGTTVLVQAVVVNAAPLVAMLPLLMAVTNPPVLVPMPLSAFVKQTRPLQQRTEKENKRCCNLLAANTARSKKAVTRV